MLCNNNENNDENEENLVYYRAINLLTTIKFLDLTETVAASIKEEMKKMVGGLSEEQRLKLKTKLRFITIDSIRNVSKDLYIQLLEELFDFKNETIRFRSHFCLFAKIEKIDYYKYPINSDFSITNLVKPILDYTSIYSKPDASFQLIKDNIKKFHYRNIFFHNFYMLWLDDYIMKESEIRSCLYTTECSLPKPWRFYIGLMASSILKNEYTCNLLENSYLSENGEESWLIEGIESIPKVLKEIAKINEILAFRPWDLKKEDIINIQTVKDPLYSLRPKLTEICVAVACIVFYQQIAGFCNSIGLIAESDENSDSLSTKEEMSCEDSETQKITEEMVHQIEEINLKSSLKNPDVDELKLLQGPIDENGKKKKLHQKLSIDSNPYTENSNSCDDSLIFPFSHHLLNPKAHFKDFKESKQEYSSSFDFNWENQGFGIISSKTEGLANSFDKAFSFIEKLTANSFGQGNRQLDTTPLRDAIAIYTERLFGIEHEDYQYHNISKLLSPPEFKTFVKLVACNPLSVTTVNFAYMMRFFRNEEIMHIILIVLLTKSKVQLTYFSKIVSEILQDRN